MFAALLVVGVVSVVPLCAMRALWPRGNGNLVGGGAKAKVRSEDCSQGTKLTLSEGVKNEESESVEKGNPPFYSRPRISWK